MRKIKIATMSTLVYESVQEILEKHGVPESKVNAISFATQVAFDDACLDMDLHKEKINVNI